LWRLRDWRILVEVILVALDLNLDKLQDILDIIEIASLVDELLLDIEDSLTVLLIEVFEGIHKIYILECDEGFLEDAEIEHFNMLKR